MVTGLLALLDDVIAISKLAAASLDDIAAQTVKTTGTAAGVVIDDAAVTPRYVVGFAAERELPIIGRIALGSLKNKILVLLPAAVFFSAFASWAITPLLMIGGVFLCFEGYEKVHQLIVPHAAHTTAPHAGSYTGDPKAAEEKTVAGAIRTDFILSAEIMAISIATILSPSLVMQVAVLFAVAIFVTAGVYGLVAIIVKADDFGIFLAQRDKASMRALGRGIVRAVPPFLKILSFVGTFAMLWVGGGIIVHGLQAFDIKGPERVVHALKESVSALTSFAVDVLGWFVGASAAAIFGMAIGAITAVMLAGLKPVWRKLRPA
jgi:predicted DNA repair protein MutK